jgi:putative membrane protein
MVDDVSYTGTTVAATVCCIEAQPEENLMNTNKILVTAAAVSLAMAGHAYADTTATKDGAKPSTAATADRKLDRHTENFFKEGAAGGMAEVELGKLAAGKATNAEVKQFGEMMVKDHSGANAKLMALAKERQIALPTELDGKHKRASENLGKKQGADFDKDYMDLMVKDHKSTIDLFEDTVKKSEDAEVKKFASATLPTLQEHLKLAQALQDKVKKSGSTAGESKSLTDRILPGRQ